MLYFLFTNTQGSTFHAMGGQNSRYAYGEKYIPQDGEFVKKTEVKRQQEHEKSILFQCKDGN